MKSIFKKIKEYDTIIIHGHVRPDGDCWGSQIGLRDMLRASFPNKEIYAVGENCSLTWFLGSMDIIDDAKYSNALAIVLDTGNSDRISDKRYTTAKYVIKIDHHIPVENYGDYQFVDTNMAATAEIIAHFYEMFKNKLVMPLSSATALYTGIITDTGRFKYDATTSATMRVAALLIDNGVDISFIDNNLSIDTLNTLKLKGYVLSNFETTDAGFAYIKMTRDVVNKYQVSDEDAASQVSTISSIEGYPVWALFMEYPDEIRIRLRSRGPAVDKLANKYGGGGHSKASGAKLDSWDNLEGFLNDVNELVTEYKKEQENI